MSSELFKKLSLMSAGKPKPELRKSSSVIIREYFESCSDELYRLSQSALLDMGLTGGTFNIEKALFIDTETTGLSGGAGTVAFLIGIGFIKSGRLNVRQYLIPDYSCEAEMLSALADVFESYETFVHFNGTRFDIPLIKERFTMKRMSERWFEHEQLDLLPPSRKVWKLRLGCCKLKYLEETVLGMPRDDDDIPGSEIPTRYFESVKTGNLSLLDDIIEHNRQDILTLASLLLKLNSIYVKPDQETEQLDLFSLGKTFDKLGQKPMAKRLFAKAAVPRPVRSIQDLRGEKYAGEANYRLFILYRRAGEYAKCEETLRNMIKRRQMGNVPYLELAKLYEHKLHNPAKALEITEFMLGSAKDDADLIKRKERLITKINNGGQHGYYCKSIYE